MVRNIQTDELIFNESVMYFPHDLSQLTSYTYFNVTILHRSDKIFSQLIRTLEDGEFDMILRMYTVRNISVYSLHISIQMYICTACYAKITFYKLISLHI